MPNNQDNNPRRKVIRVRFNFSWVYLILILGIGWLLLNNSGGGIFERFDGLRKSTARERLVMACHHTSAYGICQSYGICYRSATDSSTLAADIQWLTSEEDNGPRLLEMVTSSAMDQQAIILIENFIKNQINN